MPKGGQKVRAEAGKEAVLAAAGVVAAAAEDGGEGAPEHQQRADAEAARATASLRAAAEAAWMHRREASRSSWSNRPLSLSHCLGRSALPPDLLDLLM